MHPANWGKDTLSDFMVATHQNRLATFVNKSEAFSYLAGIDKCFVDVSYEWSIPAIKSHTFVAALLLTRAGGLYRSASECALAGQVVETFIMIRAMLEAAAYSLHIEKNSDLAEVWLRRHDDDAARGRVRRKFSVANLKATIERFDRAAVTRFDELYQEAIDFGGHPNERSVTGSMAFSDNDGSTHRYELQLLHGGDVAQEHALSTVAHSGLCSLEMLQCAFPERFELLGIKHRILDLRTTTKF